MALDAWRKVYPSELEVTVAGTEVNDTFSESVDAISVRPKIDIWVHRTDTSIAGDGVTLNARQFVGANERYIVPAWHTTTVYAVNVNSGETGKIYITGLVM